MPSGPIRPMPTILPITTPSPTFLRVDPIQGFQIDESMFGSDLLSALLRTFPSSQLGAVTLSGFPLGTVVTYVDASGNHILIEDDRNDGLQFTLSAPNSAALFSLIESLVVANSMGDEGYDLYAQIMAAGSSGATQTIVLPVFGPAMISGIPQIVAPDSLLFSGPAPIFIKVQSPGADDSEILTLSFMIATDNNGAPIGTLEAATRVNVPTISFGQLDDGSYVVSSSASSAEARQAALNIFLQGGIVFRPNTDVGSGEFPSGILVTATLAETGQWSHHGRATSSFLIKSCSTPLQVQCWRKLHSKPLLFHWLLSS